MRNFTLEQLTNLLSENGFEQADPVYIDGIECQSYLSPSTQATLIAMPLVFGNVTLYHVAASVFLDHDGKPVLAWNFVENKKAKLIDEINQSLLNNPQPH